MTAAIKTSLTQLNQALQNLEQSAANAADNARQSAKAAPKSSGMDLFSAPQASASNDVDAKALASRLDGAIAKVEKLLREGDEAHG